MALLFFEGFDHEGTGTTPFVDTGKWSASSNMWAHTFARTGSQSARAITTSSYMTSKSLVTNGGFVVGFAVYFGAAFGGGNILAVSEGTIDHLVLGVTTGGLLTVKRGTTLLATSSTPLAVNGWYYIEFKGTINETTGTYAVRVDQVPDAALTSSSGDTQNGGTGVWNKISIASPQSGDSTYFDDLYVCDTSGSAPRNTFLGPVRVETLYPQTDAVATGSNQGLTPSTGTDHGALVNEVVPNTTNYNSSATVGNKDTYNYPSLTISGTVLGVQTNLYVAKSDAAVRTVCPVIRSGGTDYDGIPVSPQTTFLYHSQVWEQNPNPTPTEWTAATIAALQAGMKVTA